MLTADFEESKDVVNEKRIDVIWLLDGEFDVLYERFDHSVSQNLLPSKV